MSGSPFLAWFGTDPNPRSWRPEWRPGPRFGENNWAFVSEGEKARPRAEAARALARAAKEASPAPAAS